MVVAVLSPVLRQRFFDANGNPLSGGKLYAYVAGSGGSTFKDTYASSSFADINPNPVILDSAGYADVWLATDGPYLFILQDSAGVLQWSVDNVFGEGGDSDVTLREDLAADDGAGLVGYLSSFAGSTATTVEGYLNLFKVLNNGNPIHTDGVNSITGSARWFIGNNAPSTDDSALLIGRGLSGSYVTGAHAIRDETAYVSPSGTGLFAYASYDSNPTLGGSANWNHLRSFQARPSFTGSGTMDEICSFHSLQNHTGSGVASYSFGMRYSNPTGAGPITLLSAIWVDPDVNRGGSNYVYYSGSTAIRSYMGGVAQFGSAPQISNGAFTVYGGVITTDATGIMLPNAQFTIINGVLTMAYITAKIDATAANLQLSGTQYVEVLKPIRYVPKTVATLPSASPAGQMSYVTDANAITFATIVAGGGANTVPVYSNGTNWYIG